MTLLKAMVIGGIIFSCVAIVSRLVVLGCAGGQMVKSSIYYVTQPGHVEIRTDHYVIEGNCVRFSAWNGERTVCGNYGIISYPTMRCVK